jgi:sterol 3beta-glucosyltransferase
LRAILTNFGTTGDIQPFLGLAGELRQHGHEAVLALSPNFASRVNELGLQFAPIGPDLQRVQSKIIAGQLSISNTVDNLRSLFAPLSSSLPQMFTDLRDVCSGADVLISGAVQPVGMMVHEITGINFVSVQLAHFGGGGRPAFQQASSAIINPFRISLGLRPLSNPLASDANSPQLALYAMSRYVVRPPKEWPCHYQMVGYFFLEETDWTPPESLVKFIEAGDAPVVVTMGSTSYEDADEMTELVLKAISQTGCRAILQQGWGGLIGKEGFPATVYSVGYAPHSWLFPRAACVVHHGGVGTTAATFRAGVPSVYITHGLPLHARIAQELGCAGPHVPFWELSSERLASAIATTLGDSSYARSAVSLGEKIRSEHGVQNARQLIEGLVNTREQTAPAGNVLALSLP